MIAPSAPVERRWRLGSRLARIFLYTTLGFVLVTTLIAVLAIKRQIVNAIDRLAEEEIEEMRSFFAGAPYEHARFEHATRTLATRHAHVPMGWRAYAPDGSLLAEAGPAELTALVRPEAFEKRRERIDRATRYALIELEDGTRIAFVLDGRSEFEGLWDFMTWTGAALLASALGALLVSRWFSKHVSVLLASVAQQASVAGAAPGTDISVSGAPEEIRAVADALHDMLARVRRESDEQRVYLAGLAHELRAPIQNLLGGTEVALRQPRAVAEYQGLLASHLDELRALGDAIDNFVALSRRGESARAGASEPFDLGEEARIRLARERGSASREGVEIGLDVGGETRLVGDREALLRALRNLVQNAIQWSPRGSRVDVSISGRSADIELTVDDAGPGVPAELGATIFEPFVQGPAAQGRRIGYGLGLALVKRAAEAHGGTVVVERSARGGARFRMLIPRRC